MLDGKAYQAHFLDDQVYGLSTPRSAPCQLNSPALMKALAALEPPLGVVLGGERRIGLHHERVRMELEELTQRQLRGVDLGQACTLERSGHRR